MEPTIDSNRPTVGGLRMRQSKRKHEKDLYHISKSINILRNVKRKLELGPEITSGENVDELEDEDQENGEEAEEKLEQNDEESEFEDCREYMYRPQSFDNQSSISSGRGDEMSEETSDDESGCTTDTNSQDGAGDISSSVSTASSENDEDQSDSSSEGSISNKKRGKKISGESTASSENDEDQSDFSSESSISNEKRGKKISGESTVAFSESEEDQSDSNSESSSKGRAKEIISSKRSENDEPTKAKRKAESLERTSKKLESKTKSLRDRRSNQLAATIK